MFHMDCNEWTMEMMEMMALFCGKCSYIFWSVGADFDIVRSHPRPPWRKETLDCVNVRHEDCCGNLRRNLTFPWILFKYVQVCKMKYE
jgi:hypothetical protein